MCAQKISVQTTELEKDIQTVATSLEHTILLTEIVLKSIGYIQSGMDPMLQHNIDDKLRKAMDYTSHCNNVLLNIKNALAHSKNTYEDADKYLKDLFTEDEYRKFLVENLTGLQQEQYGLKEPFMLNDYTDKVTDAEYARLCHLWQSKAANTDDPAQAFLDAIKNDKKIPANSPIRNLSLNQIEVTTNKDGFAALTIVGRENDSAMVIFAGTNGNFEDIIADANIAIGRSTSQSEAAISLVNELSKKYSNITVTGHSLGGYLATSATLKNSAVSRCIAFDPPGRYDAGFQALFNREQFNKVTTYEVLGSAVSLVGAEVGNYEIVNIDGKGNFCHGIAQISAALNKETPMKSAWK